MRDSRKAVRAASSVGSSTKTGRRSVIVGGLIGVGTEVFEAIIRMREFRVVLFDMAIYTVGRLNHGGNDRPQNSSCLAS